MTTENKATAPKAKKKILRAADILSQSDVDYIDVPTPEWGEDSFVRLKTLTGLEATVFQRSMETKAGKEDSLARIITLCAVDEEGKPLFTADDVVDLKRKSLRVLNRLQDAALKHNGFKVSGTIDADPVQNAKNG